MTEQEEKDTRAAEALRESMGERLAGILDELAAHAAKVKRHGGYPEPVAAFLFPTLELPRVPALLDDWQVSTAAAALLFGREVVPNPRTDSTAAATAFQIARVYLETADGDPGRDLLLAAAAAVVDAKREKQPAPKGRKGKR